MKFFTALALALPSLSFGFMQSHSQRAPWGVPSVGRMDTELCAVNLIIAGAPASGKGTQCEVITRTGSYSLYNDKWLDIEIDIPANYTCTSCWWSVDYSIPAGVAFYERTTWTVLIVGDPVRLVE